MPALAVTLAPAMRLSTVEAHARLGLLPSVKVAGTDGSFAHRWSSTDRTDWGRRSRKVGQLPAQGVRTTAGARLAGYKTPTSVAIVAELSKSASGRILERDVREKYRARAGVG
jgi:acyl-CoA synthetase (AMP-forming)/AMP-acid ligase II